MLVSEEVAILISIFSITDLSDGGEVNTVIQINAHILTL